MVRSVTALKTLLVGVIGHVDHGKTALVRALTGVETDRLKEERARGVSIVPGFALLASDRGEIDLVDLPGHERFVRAMISGATGMRAVLLAVDAHEGIKPQTVEHLEIARLIGVRRGVLALTKADLATPETVAARAAEIAAAAARAGIAAGPVIATSTVTGAGLPELSAALSGLLDETEPGRDDGFPYLPVDRVFSRPGFGTVVTGTLRRGPLAVGDTVEIAPGGRTAVVRGLQIHGRAVERAEPGRRTAVALRGIDLDEVARGQALSPPGLLAPSAWLDVTITAAAGADALAGGSACRLLFGTTEVEARLRLLDRDALEPGASTQAQLHLGEPVAVPAREPFVLRLDSPSVTVAGGRILDPASRRRRRHDPRVMADLAALAAGHAGEAITVRLGQLGAAGAPLIELARIAGIAPERARQILSEAGARAIGDRYIGAAAFAALRSGTLAALAHHHRDNPMDHGIALERLARALALPETVTGAVLRDLAAAGAVAQAGALWRRAEFDPARNESEAARRLEQVFRRAGLSPPDEAEAIGRDVRRREALTYLVGAGTVIRAVDRVQRRAVLFHREAVATAKTRLVEAFPEAGTPDMGFLAREAGATLGISRKFSIPLLEHLDATGFTRRAGDRRVIVALEPARAAPDAG
ncbi:selenocysteine-specific elongation factor [Methylobacterium phyllosphaerae]|uniref:Selenocysteine-specific elongation factor n=1 Tax=Methylobacterium phyllosphaerae TaxID=418223 RepID=A0AAE8HST3_9HYPH|nr:MULTISPECIES: selenocysteine-specific translation elongation factor [Methylobacterium]APT31779.1 selenocysteine-specific elongation factor [Methylobacterium phyllosphaerae]SFH04146.1 selenocysteine-specific elongation factor [Methylobacterium phyllosphaerae]